MSILTMDSTLKGGKYNKKTVSEIVGIKGAIFSLIKDGYQFDDDVLKEAHILKVIHNVKSYSRVGGDDCYKVAEPLKKDTESVKHIISELNKLDGGEKSDKVSDDDWDMALMEYGNDDYE